MGAVNVFVWSPLMSPVLNWPPVAVRVWVTESLLVTLTVAPGSTDASMGENMKFEMVMEVVAVAAPDPPVEDDVDGADEPDPPPPPHADSSRAAAMTVTAAPLRMPRIGPRTAQTAMEVGLNASGVPDDVWAPGYIPST